jgi:NAD(P)-dependent dehydrogenase (short-subunit alcohol dehydrogenase family)
MTTHNQQRPPQHQEEVPGREYKMTPRPTTEDADYQGSNKLRDKVALITGGDSGIGRAVAIAYAKEGADVAIVYLNEHADAIETEERVEKEGRRCLRIAGDIKDERFCRQAVEQSVEEFGRLDIVVNNAGEHFPQDSIEDITAEQLDSTFRTNVYSMFFITKAALSYLQPGSTIINTTSVTAYRGSGGLLDYSSSKGAIVSFTRSLAKNLAEKKIRVNGVAPGPVWTPLIASSYSPERVEHFGDKVALDRAGQPVEIAPSYVFLASKDSAYMTGQVLHPNGGEIINT